MSVSERQLTGPAPQAAAETVLRDLCRRSSSINAHLTKSYNVALLRACVLHETLEYAAEGGRHTTAYRVAGTRDSRSSAKVLERQHERKAEQGERLVALHKSWVASVDVVEVVKAFNRSDIELQAGGNRYLVPTALLHLPRFHESLSYAHNRGTCM